MVAWIGAFVTETVALTGQAPAIYTMAPWWRKCTGGTARFRQEPLWLASYGTTRPSLPPAWQQWTFWQYDDDARVPGVGLTDPDLYQATTAFPALRRAANKRTKLSLRAASPHQGTKAISNHQFGPHSYHKR